MSNCEQNMVKVTGIPAFEDNYIWAIHDRQHAAIVDPGDEEPVLEFLQREDLLLDAVLVTHHHGDHTGGIEALLAHRPVPVFGPRRERIASITHPLAEPERFSLPHLPLTFQVLDVPGHTAGHIAYFGHGWLFCGDTLFACGCGRLFEGTPDQMAASLTKLAALPADTAVYCAHEYTLSNIRFALAVEQENADLREREQEAVQRRREGLPTVPSTIGLELVTNPFLRCTRNDVKQAAEKAAGHSLRDSVAVFTALRQWKNLF